MSIVDDQEELAQDLRTIADRIEDGEYAVSGIEITAPSSDGLAGHFSIEFYTIEEMKRMHEVLDDQVGTDA